MALTLLSANNASTVLSAGISASATTLTVNTGTGSLFPSPVSGTSFFKLTLIDAATGTLTEIVHVTARIGDTMTIVRAQEGTVSRLWSANDIAANMMTAGTLDLLSQKALSLQIANNLSDLASPQTALTNLDLINSDGSVGRLVNIQNFTSSGTYTPTAGTKFIIVKVIGGGGGGGASLNTNSNQVSMGGGAGAGGTAISKLLISSITSTVSVIIGAAGLAGTVSAIATSGGGSSFGSYLSATGGRFGAAGLTTTLGNSMLTFNGAGGDGSNGNIANSIGGSGSQGIVLQSGYVSGAGGSSSISAGGQPLSTTGSSNPGAGGRNGSGGGGAFSYTNSAVTNGGNGGTGVVYVWEYA
ncbi:hypothetical protein [Yersinia intermedia]|uniref:glycine-rich domain-containing protein n=1 Tax=Yersinia intermedia TaxID=631 RepID=UPI0005DD0571|nr:hypothetical protein [Yersinia intermedia]CNH95415.1 Uncharacterised protein [Yersinia intermedia]